METKSMCVYDSVLGLLIVMIQTTETLLDTWVINLLPDQLFHKIIRVHQILRKYATQTLDTLTFLQFLEET